MPGRLVAVPVLLIVLATLPSLWGFVVAAVLLIAWLRRRGDGVPARASSTGTFLALTLYAGLIAIVLVTVRAALGWLDRPMIPLAQTDIAPSLARGSLGFYDKSELRLALLQLIVLWLLFAALLAQMLGRQTRQLHPLTAVFALVLYFASIHLPPYSSSLGSSVALMIWQMMAGAAIFMLIRKLTASRAMALLGAGYALLLAPVSGWSATPEIAALHWMLAPSLAFLAHKLIRALPIQTRGLVPLALCLLFNAFFPIDPLNERISSYMTHYEPARAVWYRECARGAVCDPAQKPSLGASLREAMQ